MMAARSGPSPSSVSTGCRDGRQSACATTERRAGFRENRGSSTTTRIQRGLHLGRRRMAPVAEHYRYVWSAAEQAKTENDGDGLSQCIRPLVESATPGHDGIAPALF